MELLARTYRHCRRLLTPNGWFTLGIVLAVGSLELVGRRTTSDWYDILAAAVLVLLLAFVVYRHKSTPLPWVSRIVATARRFYAWAWKFTFDFGFDLRGEPKIKRGYPAAVVALSLLLVAWCGSLFILSADIPMAMRQFGIRYFYVGYLSCMTLLWTLLVLGILLSFLLPLAMIHDNFVHAWQGPGRRPRQTEFYTMLAYLSSLVILGWLLPVWVLLLLCVASFLVNVLTMTLPANTDVQFLWRPRGSIKVRAIPWTHWIGCEFALITLVVFNLVVTACGSRVFLSAAEVRSAMPVTALLGTLLAWLAPGLMGALVWHAVMGRWRDPARKCRLQAHFVNSPAVELQKQLRSAFGSRGWAIEFAPLPADACSVPLELVEASQSQARELDPAWPLKLSMHDLSSDELFERLARRSVIQARRRIVAGLKALFKRAAARRFRKGHGFWVAPHFWFITGLSRDQHEEELDMGDNTVLSSSIGPAYYRVLPRHARHHLFQVLRALHVDLIFVEDGVSHRRVARVLRRAFEVFDKTNGQKRADDTHFAGLPGTRVMIHEFQLDEPFKSEVYPEPKYDHLGRARILHIFRDRNEQEEYIEPPFDFSRSPSPALFR
jgi:hypothetical protein